jgi:hypothetical protein
MSVFRAGLPELEREKLHQQLAAVVKAKGPGSAGATTKAIEVCRANGRDPFEMVEMPDQTSLGQPVMKKEPLYKQAIRAAVIANRLEEGSPRE